MHISTKLFLIISVVFGIGLFWNVSKTSGIFYGDALGYHSYLPATFIHHNLTSIQTLAQDSTIDEGITAGISRWKYSYATNDRGNVIVQYTYANALMNLPFFMVGHVIAVITGCAINGFSLPYLVMIKIAGIFYGLLGFWLLYLVLKDRFGKDAVVFGLTSIFIGTNLFWFMMVQSGMAHVNIFFLYCLIIFGSQKYYQSYSNIWILVVAFAIGLLTVIRPTDIIAIIIPLLYGVNSLTGLQDRWTKISVRWKAILGVGFLSFMIPIVPQIIYWYIMTGEFIFYSYQEQGFNWLNPEIIAGLFGPRNGWLTYSPLMILPLLGMLLVKNTNPMRWASWILVPLYIYIAYAWWCYNYINGFGSRPMIHIYPILAFSLVLFLHKSSKSKVVFLKLLIAIFCCVNINYTLKAIDGRIVTDESTHAFNFATFFKKTINYQDLILRDTKVWQNEISTSKVIKAFDNQDSTSFMNIYDKGQEAFYIGPESEYSPFTIEHQFTQTDIDQYKYLRVGGDFMAPELVYNMYNHHILVLTVERSGENVHWYGIKLNNKIGKTDDTKGLQIQTCVVGEWGEVFFTLPLHNIEVGDVLKTMIWNPDRKKMYLRQLLFELGN